ncbi:MAG: YHYH protein [Planctomyces sp.]
MVGITAWQQQVPLPQKYNGENAWRIPLNPVPAKAPMSAKTNFFRGAIAIAVNGVPIFNPIKNDGKTDTLLAGELDNFGGHCGRADDYHYHIAPVHLEKQTGSGTPVGWALDG